jgi:ligand-binding sensor domain-containing protein
MAFYGFQIKDRIFIPQENIGISELKNDQLYPLKNTVFSSHIGMIHYTEKEFIISHNDSLYLYNLETESHKPFKSAANDYLYQNLYYCNSRIDENRFAIGTIFGGVLILNNQGKIEQIINEPRGMEGSVYHLFTDQDKNLWASTNNGIIKIDISFPVQQFTKNQNIKDYTLTNIRFKNTLYVGAMTGLMYLPPIRYQIIRIITVFAESKVFRVDAGD